MTSIDVKTGVSPGTPGSMNFAIAAAKASSIRSLRSLSSFAAAGWIRVPAGNRCINSINSIY